ncbi:MAG: hypothetical protein ACRDH2_15840, partial [Anaerolineales bacterium]
RSGYKKYLSPAGEPYYAIYNIGPYTFAPYKVVWKEQSTLFQCAVISSDNGKVIIYRVSTLNLSGVCFKFRRE